MMAGQPTTTRRARIRKQLDYRVEGLDCNEEATLLRDALTDREGLVTCNGLRMLRPVGAPGAPFAEPAVAAASQQM